MLMQNVDGPVGPVTPLGSTDPGTSLPPRPYLNVLHCG